VPRIASNRAETLLSNQSLALYPAIKEAGGGRLTCGWKGVGCVSAALLCAAIGGDSTDTCRPRGPVPYDPPVFFGFRCAADCREHRWGFAWAARLRISGASECASGSQGFVEGCTAYALERLAPEQAGYEWAEENGINRSCACNGAGRGFGSGCRAYVAARYRPIPETIGAAGTGYGDIVK
jgi:hypothetical protein